MLRVGFTGGIVGLAIHEPGIRTGVEYEPGAVGAAAAQNGGHRRLRREVGLGSGGGPAGRLEDRFGLRLAGSDH